MNLFLSRDNFGSILLLFSALILFNSCLERPPQERNEIIKTEYPKIADAVIGRNFDRLWSFTTHENEDVRKLAWKSIAKSKSPNLHEFFEYAIQYDNSFAWYALSFHPLSDKQVEFLNEYFADGIIRSEGVCEVFFRKGNLTTLNMLLNKKEQILKSEKCAKAVGGILSRIEVDDLKKREAFSLAVNSDHAIIWRNFLYGFYRSPINRPAEGSVLMNDFSTLLDNYDGHFSTMMDEYIVRILGKTGFMKVMERRSDITLNHAIQLSTELANTMTLFKKSELNHPHIKRLLRHPVDNVVAQSLQSLKGFDTIPDELINLVNNEIAPNTRDGEVFIEALELLIKNEVDIEEYKYKMEYLGHHNEFLKDRILTLFSTFESTDDYLERVRRDVHDGGITGSMALQSLASYYSENVEEPGINRKVRAIVLNVLEESDATMFSSLNMFLMSSDLFTEEDYERLHTLYKAFAEAGEWDKAYVLRSVFENRFQDRFEALERPELSFRIPDWNRLYEMGIQPFWRLKTEKGIIEIQLDPLAAPFTVSSVDSLTRAGEYDNISFHRIVRNFVVQGGDITLDKNDQLRVDYRLPTEPSFQSFERGMVGIASSGQDTEGSQFFIMLNWSPHLDGNYTVFGRVTKGMEVADRIQIGDKVLKAEISLR